MEEHAHSNDVSGHEPDLEPTIPTILPNEKDGKHYSITQSLALEHQLNSEIDNEQSQSATMSRGGDESFPSPSSLNPEVLHSIVVELRSTLKRERDNFSVALRDAAAKYAHLEVRNANLEEIVNAERARGDEAEAKLAEVEQKYMESEQSLTMLRSKLEDSRRSIMRLQSDQSKRASTLSVPSTSTKRMSLISNGLTVPASHRKIPSLTDASMIIPSSPPPRVLTIGDGSAFPSPSLAPNNVPTQSRPTSPPTDVNADPLHLSTAEVGSLKKELAVAKAALAEAQEARQASEDCLRALREFIGSSSSASNDSQFPDMLNIQLPPLPTDIDVDGHGDPDVDTGKKATVGWGLKLWKDSSSPASYIAPNAAPTSRSSMDRLQPSDQNRESFMSSVSSSSTVPTARASSPPTSFRSKFGFFSKVAPAAFASSNTPTPSVSSQDSGMAKSPGDRISIASFSTRTVDSSSEGPHTDDDIIPVILPKDSGTASDDMKTPVSEA